MLVAMLNMIEDLHIAVHHSPSEELARMAHSLWNNTGARALPDVYTAYSLADTVQDMSEAEMLRRMELAEHIGNFVCVQAVVRDDEFGATVAVLWGSNYRTSLGRPAIPRTGKVALMAIGQFSILPPYADDGLEHVVEEAFYNEFAAYQHLLGASVAAIRARLQAMSQDTQPVASLTHFD